MSENLNELLQQFSALAQLHRTGDFGAFSALGLTTEERVDADHMVQSHSVGLSVDREGRPILCVHIQDKRYRNSSIVKWLRKESRGHIRVVYTGKIIASCGSPPLKASVDPLQIGYSVGNQAFNDAGTIGFFGKLNQSDSSVLVSCNHVLVIQDDSATNVVVQPGLVEADPNTRAIADAVKWIDIGLTGNEVDAAYALIDGSPICEVPPGLPPITGTTTEPQPEMIVLKVGRSTQVTKGKIDSHIHAEVSINYPRFQNRNLPFSNLFSITSTEKCSFSHAGDSGSLIVNEAGQAVGMVIATAFGDMSDSRRVTYGCRIGPVLDTLDVQILPCS